MATDPTPPSPLALLVAASGWVLDHPAETVALLVETGVLVQIPNLWWDSRPEPIGQHWYSNVTANRGPHRPEDSPGYRVSLPTSPEDDDAEPS